MGCAAHNRYEVLRLIACARTRPPRGYPHVERIGSPPARERERNALLTRRAFYALAKRLGVATRPYAHQQLLAARW